MLLATAVLKNGKKHLVCVGPDEEIMFKVLAHVSYVYENYFKVFYSWAPVTQKCVHLALSHLILHYNLRQKVGMWRLQ